jgi:hypothetical protein
MRIRVPHRTLALGCLLVLLCLVPSVASVAHARPISWDPWGDNPIPGPGPAPKGDNDGGVLAGAFYRPATTGAVETKGIVAPNGSRSPWTAVRTVYSYAGLRGFLTLVRLEGWPFQLR